MDYGPELAQADSIVVTGAGSCILPAAAGGVDLCMQTDTSLDVVPWLKSKKTFKFMGKQDQLSVIAASRAFQASSIKCRIQPERVGLYLSVGYIPFERDDIESLALNSSSNGKFSMDLFSSQAVQRVNPLLTFRCLSNMPAFHISMNLGITGPYSVSYPAVGQTYIVLEQAIAALQEGRIDLALVGGVADQNNFLVERHLERLQFAANIPHLDAASFICLECRDLAKKRNAPILAQLCSIHIGYDPPDFLCHIPKHRELLRFAETKVSANETGWLGPASLPAAVAWQIKTESVELVHDVGTSDGIKASSRWRLFP